MNIKLEDLDELEIDGVNIKDYPDFCDAYFSRATWLENGDELTDEQLDWLTDNYPEVVNEMSFEYYL